MEGESHLATDLGGSDGGRKTNIDAAGSSFQGSECAGRGFVQQFAIALALERPQDLRFGHQVLCPHAITDLSCTTNPENAAPLVLLCHSEFCNPPHIRLCSHLR
jgi:hypothetical protein